MKNIVFLLSRTFAYDRGIMRGAIAAARMNPDWRLRHLSTRGEVAEQLRLLSPDGVIAHIPDKEIQEALLDMGVPTVSVSNRLSHQLFPRVGVDEREVARLAARTLRHQGVQNFAILAGQAGHFGGEREAAFVAEITRLGLPLHRPPENWELHPEGLLKWIRGLEKPVGFFAVHDDLGATLLEVCLQARVRVPEDVLVLGVDNDDLVCETAAWPLSSIALPTRLIGETAVRLLQQLMEKDPLSSVPPVLFPPVNVIVRLSTDIIASDIPEVNAAVRFIRSARDRNISVGDVVRHVGASRRKLEQLVSNALGTTLLHLIHLEHVALARELLSTTTLTLDQIAEATGLVSREQLSRVFKRVTRQTPAAYRKANRHLPSIDTIPSGDAI